MEQQDQEMIMNLEDYDYDIPEISSTEDLLKSVFKITKKDKWKDKLIDSSLHPRLDTYTSRKFNQW